MKHHYRAFTRPCLQLVSVSRLRVQRSYVVPFLSKWSTAYQDRVQSTTGATTPRCPFLNRPKSITIESTGPLTQRPCVASHLQIAYSPSGPSPLGHGCNDPALPPSYTRSKVYRGLTRTTTDSNSVGLLSLQTGFYKYDHVRRQPTSSGNSYVLPALQDIPTQ